MLSEIEYKKLAWHSRRGMLELDLLLLPFVEQYLKQQSAEDQLLYRELLAEEDQDLFAWLVERATPPRPELAHIVSIIRRTVVDRHKAG